MPGADPKTTAAGVLAAQKPADGEATLQRLAEESFAIHLKYGGEFVDENPITGRPGEFHLSSTGRKDNKAAASAVASASSAATGAQASKGAAAATTAGGAKAGEEPKKGSRSPETANLAKPKRRKSKIGPGAVAS